MSARSGRAEAGEEAADDFFVERAEMFIGELKLLGVRPLAVDKNGIGLRNHPAEQRQPSGERTSSATLFLFRLKH